MAMYLASLLMSRGGGHMFTHQGVNKTEKSEIAPPFDTWGKRMTARAFGEVALQYRHVPLIGLWKIRMRGQMCHH